MTTARKSCALAHPHNAKATVVATVEAAGEVVPDALARQGFGISRQETSGQIVLCLLGLRE